jgi:hypothetical protein
VHDDRTNPFGPFAIRTENTHQGAYPKNSQTATATTAKPGVLPMQIEAFFELMAPAVAINAEIAFFILPSPD